MSTSWSSSLRNYSDIRKLHEAEPPRFCGFKLPAKCQFEKQKSWHTTKLLGSIQDGKISLTKRLLTCQRGLRWGIWFVVWSNHQRTLFVNTLVSYALDAFLITTAVWKKLFYGNFDGNYGVLTAFPFWSHLFSDKVRLHKVNNPIYTRRN